MPDTELTEHLHKWKTSVYVFIQVSVYSFDLSMAVTRCFVEFHNLFACVVLNEAIYTSYFWYGYDKNVR